ncbi:unnamed protein product [Prorocentrum cordatum]|uniref:Uncharacterized protein n=1 Tax=Prorocentrum cordatum TaxID=2364126 RepID=A0ABN9T907_9DINO|nr:unnamed protein product [Polarella glacialis]
MPDAVGERKKKTARPGPVCMLLVGLTLLLALQLTTNKKIVTIIPDLGMVRPLTMVTKAWVCSPEIRSSSASPMNGCPRGLRVHAICAQVGAVDTRTENIAREVESMRSILAEMRSEFAMANYMPPTAASGHHKLPARCCLNQSATGGHYHGTMR